MPKKQSSSRLSTIASKVLRQLKGVPLSAAICGWHRIAVADVNALAASVLSQDETKGQKKRVTTFTVKPGTDFGWKIYEGKVQIGFSLRKTEAVTLAKQQAARLKPSRVVLHVGKSKKTLKEFR